MAKRVKMRDLQGNICYPVTLKSCIVNDAGSGGEELYVKKFVVESTDIHADGSTYYISDELTPDASDGDLMFDSDGNIYLYSDSDSLTHKTYWIMVEGEEAGIFTKKFIVNSSDMDNNESVSSSLTPNASNGDLLYINGSGGTRLYLYAYTQQETNRTYWRKLLTLSDVDSSMSDSSNRPVRNSAIKAYVDTKATEHIWELEINESNDTPPSSDKSDFTNVKIGDLCYTKYSNTDTVLELYYAFQTTSAYVYWRKVPKYSDLKSKQTVFVKTLHSTDSGDTTPSTTPSTFQELKLGDLCYTKYEGTNNITKMFIAAQITSSYIYWVELPIYGTNRVCPKVYMWDYYTQGDISSSTNAFPGIEEGDLCKTKVSHVGDYSDEVLMALHITNSTITWVQIASINKILVPKPSVSDAEKALVVNQYGVPEWQTVSIQSQPTNIIQSQPANIQMQTTVQTEIEEDE